MKKVVTDFVGSMKAKWTETFAPRLAKITDKGERNKFYLDSLKDKNSNIGLFADIETILEFKEVIVDEGYFIHLLGKNHTIPEDVVTEIIELADYKGVDLGPWGWEVISEYAARFFADAFIERYKEHINREIVQNTKSLHIAK